MKLTRTDAVPRVGKLLPQEERHHKPQFRRLSIDPRVKTWIDNVIVPALIDEWKKNKGSNVAV